jgi:hypothetical protein
VGLLKQNQDDDINKTKDLLEKGVKDVVKTIEKLSRENISTSTSFPTKPEIEKFNKLYSNIVDESGI